MFTLRRSAAIAAAAIIIFGGLLGIACGGIASAQSARPPVIVIDAGHGGIDAGVYGKASGVKESEINLAIARELAGYFDAAGFCAVLTRKTQGGLYGLPVKGFKMRDMNARRDTIVRCGADMVISVHQNTFPDSTRRGAQVFFYPGRENGRKLAACIQRSLNGTALGDGKEPLAGDYFMLRCTDSPSVVVECGFLSNDEDERLLLTEEGRRDAAYAVFMGVVEYFSPQ